MNILEYITLGWCLWLLACTFAPYME